MRCAGAAAGRGMLLTTLTGESHGLGILMAEAIFALADCECLGLGPQTPLHDIVDAVAAHEVDIVALSFSAAMPAQAVTNGLTELRSLLPRERGNLGRRQQSGAAAQAP